MILLTLALGCSDYDLKGDTEYAPFEEDSGIEEPEDTEDSAPPPVDCPVEAYPGYAASTDGACASEPPTGTFTPVLEWSIDTFAESPSSKSVMMTPVIADVDGDDIPDILFVTYPDTSWTSMGVLRAVSGDGAGEIWSVTASDLQGCTGLAVGDIDNDGEVEIIGVTTSSRLRAFEADGTVKWTSDAYNTDLGNYAAAPAIADMDGDGSPEITAGRVILNADGTLRGRGSGGIASAGVYGSVSVPVDLDGDGQLELVTGTAAYDADGNTLWSVGGADGYVAVADFDADGKGEIVVSGNATVRLLDEDGGPLWTAAIPRATSGYGGPPTVADFDGDGAPEVGVAANSTYTVFDTDGTLLWQQTTQDGSSGVTGSSVYDFEGDGVAEAVYADETRLWVFNGPDGARRLEADHSSWTVIEYPTIADVDGDGHAEIVVARNIHPSYSASAKYGIAVWGDADDSWRPGRAVWNQYAYSITNVDDDGGIPRNPEQNWVEYNNFRSGDIESHEGTTQPDLVVATAGLCELDCDEGRLVAYVNPGNQGAADQPAGAWVDVYAEIGGVDTWLTSAPITAPLPVGAYADALTIDLRGVAPATWDRLRFEIVGTVLECDDTNNVTAFEGPFCG